MSPHKFHQLNHTDIQTVNQIFRININNVTGIEIVEMTMNTPFLRSQTSI